MVVLLSCMETTYLAGPPPAKTAVYLEVLSAEPIPDPTNVGGTPLRTRLRLGWNMSPFDFRVRPYYILLEEPTGTPSRKIPLTVPCDTIVDTFTCTRRQVMARLFAQSGTEHVVELDQKTFVVATP